MGLCLYLALMNHLLKGSFTFAVLDDVLMSVDAGHRREVTKMLKEKFPNTQFILTTHDEIWHRHMKTAGLVAPKSALHFRKWTVDLGPTEWDDRDVWQEIDDHLGKNDVRAAAGLLRHYLEHVSQEICHRLRAKVEFRGDAQFTLGDLLPNALAALSSAFKKGKAAAQSWGMQQVSDALTAKETVYDAARAASNVEQWQVNAAVHYNAWATLDKRDFAPVVTAYKDLLTHFGCGQCHALFYLSPDRGEAEIMRCDCTQSSVNFKRKEVVRAAS
jgi:hypothetical protein